MPSTTAETAFRAAGAFDGWVARAQRSGLIFDVVADARSFTVRLAGCAPGILGKEPEGKIVKGSVGRAACPECRFEEGRKAVSPAATGGAGGGPRAGGRERWVCRVIRAR